MADANNQVKLHAYIEAEVATISPLEARSKELEKQAQDLKIETAEDVDTAKQLRKDIIAHDKAVNGMRLEITRQLDDVKKTLINAERNVLAPNVHAKTLVGDKILAYEAEQERLAALEKERQHKIITALVENGGVQIYQIRSLKDLAAYEEKFEKRVTELNEDDAKLASVISIIADVRYAISERRDTIRRLDKESNEAKQRELERQAEQARAEKEASKQAKAADKAAAQPKTGSRVRMTFEIVKPELVPRELCVPSDALIRAYINDNNLEHLDGVLIKREKVL